MATKIDKTAFFSNKEAKIETFGKSNFAFSETKFKIKFIFEWCFAAFITILLSPVFLLISILVKVSSPGPIFFLQKRIGYKQKVFNIIKFRSLKLVPEESEKEKNCSNFAPERFTDPKRLTKIGYFIRRTKIDELPQLFNILRGEMAIVGPRPHPPEDFRNIPPAKMELRGKVRPGLTGLRQINGNVALSYEEEIYYDIFYIKNWSFILDIKIILKTFLVIVLGEKKFIKHVSPDLLEKKDD